jgi:hypothetical protein
VCGAASQVKRRRLFASTAIIANTVGNIRVADTTMSVFVAVIIFLDFAIIICYINREQQSSKGDLSKTVMFFAGVFSFLTSNLYQK